MTVTICDWCGDVTINRDPCRCADRHDLVEIRRRHRRAVTRARMSDVRESRRERRPRVA